MTAEKLIENNSRYADSFTADDLPAAPALRLAVVSCMDARLETGRLLGLELGEAHVIRNAGGVVTDDVIRSLTISQRKLGTREIMVVQHTKCGMVTFSGEEFRDELERETGQRPGFEMGTFSDLEQNVRDSVAKLKGCPFLPNVESVRGFVYEVESGRLREIG